MVRGALLKKALRDMRRSKAQFISIFLMAGLTVSIVTGIDSMWKTIETHSEDMYARAGMADLWVSVLNPTPEQMKRVSGAEGVERAEKRFVANAQSDLEGEPTLRLYTLSRESAMDLPELQAGGLRSRSGVILDAAFASARGLAINDRISIRLNERWMKFTVEGLALSAEQIYLSEGSPGALPSHEDFGFLFLREEALKGAYGRVLYNEISIRLAPGADERQVQGAIREILGEDLIGITSRKDNASASNVRAFIQQFKTLAAVFPLLFFLVTALITQSTMVRLVESQRMEIGILKALGYTRGRILRHYTSYGVVVGMGGALLGLLAGPRLFGGILVPRIGLNFSDNSLVINYGNFVVSLVLILLCTGGVSLYACLRLQGEVPALLLREKPPKEGGHIFLEAFSGLWRRMKFSWKLIARNTVKNKMRLLMSILGVMGCAGLIMGAFAIRDMIEGITLRMYGDIYRYDQKIILEEKADAHLVHNMRFDGVTQEIMETGVSILSADGAQGMKQLTVLSPESPLIRFQDERGEGLNLSGDGLIVTRKLAETLSVKVGDQVGIKRSEGGYVAVPVKQIVYMAAGQGLFLTRDYYESLGETYKTTAVLIRWNGSPDQSFLNGDFVQEHVDRDSQIADMDSNTTVVNIAASMMILMGAMLAFVVLYNSSMLNYAERIRDLATLRVLGFHQQEIRALVVTENLLCVVLGVLLGIPVGKGIVDIVAGGLDDRLDLMGQISPGNVLLSALLTTVFTLLINAVVANKMKTLDMLQALKSVE